MEAAVEQTLKDEVFHLELVTKKLSALNVIQITPVSFILHSIIFIKTVFTNC